LWQLYIPVLSPASFRLYAHGEFLLSDREPITKVITPRATGFGTRLGLNGMGCIGLLW
jgi:hypothetical protein